MVLQKQDKNSQINLMNIDETTKLVKLVGITTDSQLRFDEHISNLCNKASLQLNAINTLQRYMGSQQMKAIINRNEEDKKKKCYCKSICVTHKLNKKVRHIFSSNIVGFFFYKKKFLTVF